MYAMDYRKPGGVLELMSNLKFRVWHKGFEKFLSKDEWALDFDGNLIFKYITDDSFAKADEDLYEVNRYTGLYDKNGQEIYEGDIIRGKMDFGPAGFVEQQLSVQWNNREGYRWNYWCIPSIEIVGNIYTWN